MLYQCYCAIDEIKVILHYGTLMFFEYHHSSDTVNDIEYLPRTMFNIYNDTSILPLDHTHMI